MDGYTPHLCSYKDHLLLLNWADKNISLLTSRREEKRTTHHDLGGERKVTGNLCVINDFNYSLVRRRRSM